MWLTVWAYLACVLFVLSYTVSINSQRSLVRFLCSGRLASGCTVEGFDKKSGSWNEGLDIS